MNIVRHHFQTIGSTNTWAKEHASEFNKDAITLVTADEQTAGRGRFDREWISPGQGNIYASYCIFLEERRLDLGNIPQVLTLSAVKALEKFGFEPTLKWPNDIILSQRKVGGVLAETTMFNGSLWMIIGIGINVNTPEEVLMEIDKPATSLLIEGLHNQDSEMILKQLSEEFAADIDLFLAKGFEPFCERYKEYLHFDPRMIIHFQDNHNMWEGTIQSVTEDGALVMKLKNGDTRTFIAGEIL